MILNSVLTNCVAVMSMKHRREKMTHFYIFRSYFRGNFPVFRISEGGYALRMHLRIFPLTSCIPISALSHPLPFSIQPFLWALIWFRISTLVGTVPNSTRKYISLILDRLYLGREVKFQSPSAAGGKGKKFHYKNAIKVIPQK